MKKNSFARVSAVAFALCVALSPFASAQDSPATGGPGGQVFRLTCGDYASGIAAFHSSGVNEIFLLCEYDDYDLSRAAGRQSGGLKTYNCGRGEALAGWAIQSHGPYVGFIEPHCRSLLKPFSPTASAGATFGTKALGAAPAVVDCPTGQVASGIYGGAGNLVDRVGLICADPPPMTGGLMTVNRSNFGTETLLPSIEVGRFRYRVDQCLQFGRDCGEPAATAYCRSMDPTFRGTAIFQTESWPWTVVQTTKQTCFGSQCVGFKSIFCRSEQARVVGGATIPPDVNSSPGGQVGYSILYGVDESGNLQWYRHEAVGTWEGPRQVDVGWSQFAGLYPGTTWTAQNNQHGASIFALNNNGTLMWYRHDGYLDGAAIWQPPVQVGNGWGEYQSIFAGGEGILYAITPQGVLRWYRYYDAATGSNAANWSPAVDVGSGWAQFAQVFAMGEGVVYALQSDGTLLWYRHIDYLTGVEPRSANPGANALGKRVARWEGPKTVESGWQRYSKIFATGGGYIYAIDDAGDLYFYVHRGYRTGDTRWTPAMKIGNGWNRFSHVVGVISSTP